LKFTKLDEIPKAPKLPKAPKDDKAPTRIVRLSNQPTVFNQYAIYDEKNELEDYYHTIAKGPQSDNVIKSNIGNYRKCSR
jgi:hypothetical protein